MITISISGRLLDAIYALVASMTPEAPETVPETAPEAAAKAAKDTAPVASGRRRKKAAPREHVAVTRDEAPVESIKADETPLDLIRPDETPLDLIRPDEPPLAPIKPVVPLAPKAPPPVALDDEWPATLTKPSSWDYDEYGASWRAANQVGTAELGAALQRVYVDHADIIKMPSVRVAMSKLGVEGWWRCVAKNIAEARDASNRPLDITPKREAQND